MVERDIGGVEYSLVVYATSHGGQVNLVERRVVCILCIQMAEHPYLQFSSVHILDRSSAVLTASLMPLRKGSATASNEGSGRTYS